MSPSHNQLQLASIQCTSSNNLYLSLSTTHKATPGSSSIPTHQQWCLQTQTLQHISTARHHTPEFAYHVTIILAVHLVHHWSQVSQIKEITVMVTVHTNTSITDRQLSHHQTPTATYSYIQDYVSFGLHILTKVFNFIYALHT